MQSWALTMEKVSGNRHRKSTTGNRRSTTRNRQQPPTEWHLSIDSRQPKKTTTTDRHTRQLKVNNWQKENTVIQGWKQQPFQGSFATRLKPITTDQQHNYVFFSSKIQHQCFQTFGLDNNKQTRPLFVSTDWQSKTDDVDRQISCRTCRIVTYSAQLCTHVCSYSTG